MRFLFLFIFNYIHNDKKILEFKKKNQIFHHYILLSNFSKY